MKELNATTPVIFISEEMQMPNGAKFKLLFSTNTELIFQICARLKVHRNCLQQYDDHACLKLYENKYHFIGMFKYEVKKADEIVSKLNEVYNEEANSKQDS